MDTKQFFNCRNKSEQPFQFFIGARGIGKTYSSLYGHYLDFKESKTNRIIYMRLSGTELDTSASVACNPYKRINLDHNLNIRLESTSTKVYAIMDETEEDNPEQIGYGVALSTLGTLRGMDFSDVSEIYFDEFIPADKAVQTSAIKKAGGLFFNAYETINRNRELMGEPPVRVYFTANAFSLKSNILSSFDIVRVIESMQRHQQMKCTIPERGIYINLCKNEISSQKAKTALYKAVGDKSEFIGMALDNKFQDRELDTATKEVSLAEYKAEFSFMDIVVYLHKAQRMLYCKQGSGKELALVPKEKRFKISNFMKMQLEYRMAYKVMQMENNIRYDSAETRFTLDEYMTIRE